MWDSPIDSEHLLRHRIADSNHSRTPTEMTSYRTRKQLERMISEPPEHRSEPSVGGGQHGGRSVAAPGELDSSINSPSAESNRVQRLSPDDLFALKHIRSAGLAPDACSIAYAASRTDDSEHVAICIVHLTTGEKRELLYSGIAHAPCWSPDGSRIAFIGDGQLRIADAHSLDISEPLTPAGQTVEGRPSWSPDSTRIVVCLREHRVARGPRRLSDNVFRVDGIGFLDHFTQRIFVVGAADSSLHCLTDATEFCVQPQWSPCGRRILFLARNEVLPFETGSQRLKIASLDNGAITELLGANWYVEAARWVPSGERIVVSAAKDSILTVPTLGIWIIDAVTGHAEQRMAAAAAHVGFRLNHDMPSRELASTNGLVVAGDEVAFITMQKGGCAEIWRVALSGDPIVRPVIQGDRACVVLDANLNADVLLYAWTDLHRPFELAITSLLGTGEVQLTDLNDSVLRHWPVNVVEPFSFKSADGTMIDAWFMSMAGQRKPLPTVLFIHAGPFLCTGHAFRYDFHHLTSHGYGVLFANFRGSTGYGEGFMRAIADDWGARGYPDHMGAVDAAIELGYADPMRLGVWGPSHGGFATCWIVGHTNRFRAAVAEAASTNFTTLYYQTDAPQTYRRELGGRPHEIPDVYRSRSPITYAHRCTTPTLLLHGEDDLRCPIGEAEQFYRTLWDVGCPTELLRIPSCSHVGDSIGPLSARRAQNEALVSWFDRYL